MMVMFVLGVIMGMCAVIADPHLERALVGALKARGGREQLPAKGGPYRSVMGLAHEEQVVDEQLDPDQLRLCSVPTEKLAATMSKAEVVMKLVLIEEKLDELIVRAKVGGGVR